MTAVEHPWLDWRSQLRHLQPYFQGGRGGFVHVQVGPTGPASSFAKAIRWKLESGQWAFPWSTVQIDPSREGNASTHYVADIVQQIAKNVGLAIKPEGARQVSLRM